MTDKELLKQKLEDAKVKLEEKGFYLGEEGELMDLFPAMKQYEYAFQDAIEEVWIDEPWWKVTNYWDIFQDSIMSGKKADEVIEDILNHIEIKDSESETEEVEDEDMFKDIDDDIEVESKFEEDEDEIISNEDDEEHIITDREEVLTDEEKPNWVKDESLEDCDDCEVTDSVFELVKDLDKGE
jgi:hypothetical protein